MASIATYCFAVSEINIFLALLVDALFLVFANIRVTLSERFRKQSFIWVPLLAAVVVFLMSQVMMIVNIREITLSGLAMSLLICFIVIQVSSFAAGSCFKGTVIGGTILLVFSTVDYLVLMFRGSELTPFDFLAVETAMNVSGEYVFPIRSGFASAWAIYILFLVLLSDINLPRIERKNVLKTVTVMSAAAVIMIALLSGTVTSYRWGNMGSLKCGTYANFLLELQEMRVKKPSGYNAADLNKEMLGYKKVTADDTPNIIVIMNESFADLQEVYAHVQTNEPVMPYFDSFENNTIKGYAYSSIYGGNTCCSEFEFLTGNTMAFLPPGSIPYQQFVDDETYSMVSVLKKLGYRCEAMHPFFANGWNRDKAYPMLGFDESFFIEDFPPVETVRGYVSDKAMYKMVIERFNKKPKNKPLFLFGVTMQNHGAYEDESFDNFITIKGHEGEYPEAEQYMSLINISDSALRYLIKKFKKVDEHTIIVFFGDHLPSLSREFYEYAAGENNDDISLSQEIEKYKVPFLIWANYDIESSEVDMTSLNYLSQYVYEAAGIHSGYETYLRELSASIPVVNSQAYYSVSEKRFQEIKKAEGKERDALEQYKRLQYNKIKDNKNRLEMFAVN